MKIIQMGMGNRGDIWLESIGDSQVMELAGCVEIDERIISEQCAKFNIPRAKVFPTLEAALAHVQAEAVLDVTPPNFHWPNAQIALDAGLPVLAEKPLADTWEVAQAIAHKAEDSRRLYMVAQNYRYTAVMQTLRSTLEEIGTIGSVELSFHKAVRFGGYRDHMAYPLTIDMSIHHFDLMRYLLNSNPVTMQGQSWSAPWSWFAGDAETALLLRFENNARVTYHASWTAAGMETTWNGHWRFHGDRGVVKLERDIITMQRWLGVEGNLHRYGDVETVPIMEMELEPVPYLLQSFYEAVTVGTKPETRAQDNLYSIRMVFDAIRAFETGRVIKMADE